VKIEVFSLSLSYSVCIAATRDATNFVFALLKVNVFIFACRVEEKRQWRKTKPFAENTSLSVRSGQLEYTF